jgi:hypothetical protein
VKPDAAETFWQRFLATYRFRRRFGRENWWAHFGARSAQPGVRSKAGEAERESGAMRSYRDREAVAIAGGMTHHDGRAIMDVQRNVCARP